MKRLKNEDFGLKRVNNDSDLDAFFNDFKVLDGPGSWTTSHVAKVTFHFEFINYIFIQIEMF